MEEARARAGLFGSGFVPGGALGLKVVAAGYDMLYERGEKGNDGEEAIDVLGIVNQRAVR